MRIEEVLFLEQFDQNSHYRTFEGRIKKMHETSKIRTQQKGHKGEMISLDDFMRLAKRSPRYKRLYDEWVKSDFDPNLTPTLDRKDHKKGYVKGNLQFLTKSSNTTKGNIEYEKNPSVFKQEKVVLKKGNKKKEFDSMADAARFLDVETSSVTRAAAEKREIQGWKAKRV